jgi:hypothetical protein
VREQQTGLAVNEEHLLHAIQQRVEEDDLAKRLARAIRLEPPAHRPPRHAVLERAVQRFDHRRQAGGNGTTDGRADDREQGVGKRAGIAANGGRDRLFDRRRQGAREIGIVGALQQRLRQHRADVARLRGTIVEPRLQSLQLLLGGAEQNRSQRRQVVVTLGAGACGGRIRRKHHARAHRAGSCGLPIDESLASFIAISVKSAASVPRSAFAVRRSTAS